VTRLPSLENLAPLAEVATDIHPWGKTKADAASHGQRYGEWIAALKRADIFPIEQLLPRIIISECGKLPPAMQRAHERGLSPDLLRQIRAHNWGYWFSLGSGESTFRGGREQGAQERRSRQRMLYRMNAINGAIAALYGGDLGGKRVIDLACNHGAFSLDLIARGAAFARGVDLRPENIAKARLLAQHLEIENVEFEQSDIYEESGQQEIVLCLGVLYHVTRPYELVELCYRLSTEMAVVDTTTHREPFSGFVLGLGENIPAEHAAGSIRTELHPTYRGLIDLMRAVGFREIIEVEGVPDPSWIEWEKDIYATRHRRCLVGLK
jgi:SAM-dependent methyltransferase